jgi:hypothetical protein
MPASFPVRPHPYATHPQTQLRSHPHNSILIVLHVQAVNISLTVYDTDAPLVPQGPFSVGGYINLPTVTSSLDIQIDVPSWPWLDGNSGALVIVPGPPPPSPPPLPPLPPRPPKPPVAPNTTVVISEVGVPCLSGST